jgi:hypothetical protein
MFLIKNKPIRLIESINIEYMVFHARMNHANHKIKTQFDLSNLIRIKNNLKPVTTKRQSSPSPKQPVINNFIILNNYLKFNFILLKV